MTTISVGGVSSGYYETPTGKVAYVYGIDGKRKTVTYMFDRRCIEEPYRSRSATFEELKRWKLRSDLKDFPNATDPRLPYVFDLLWDIKYTSDLMCVLQSSTHPDLESIKRKVAELKLKV